MFDACTYCTVFCKSYYMLSKMSIKSYINSSRLANLFHNMHKERSTINILISGNSVMNSWRIVLDHHIPGHLYVHHLSIIVSLFWGSKTEENNNCRQILTTGWTLHFLSFSCLTFPWGIILAHYIMEIAWKWALFTFSILVLHISRNMFCLFELIKMCPA